MRDRVNNLQLNNSIRQQAQAPACASFGRRAAGRERRPRPTGDGRPLLDRSVPVSAPSPQSTADVLVHALPYIRRFAGQVVVVKYGGNALAGASDEQLAALRAEGIIA